MNATDDSIGIVNLGALTKELAKQAIGDRVKDVVDSVTETGTPAPAKPAAPEPTLGSLILGQLQAMQNALKDDMELTVLCNTGIEVLRIREIFMPSWKVAVLIGTDANNVLTRVIQPVESLNLTCKPMPVQTPGSPVRLKFVGPKA